MKLPLPVPAPYDFERSTFRFRMFGDDLASRWQGGGLHRVLRSGLPVRIEADGLTAYGTYTERDRDEVAHLLGVHEGTVSRQTDKLRERFSRII